MVPRYPSGRLVAAPKLLIKRPNNRASKSKKNQTIKLMSCLILSQSKVASQRHRLTPTPASILKVNLVEKRATKAVCRYRYKTKQDLLCLQHLASFDKPLEVPLIKTDCTYLKMITSEKSFRLIPVARSLYLTVDQQAILQCRAT